MTSLPALEEAVTVETVWREFGAALRAFVRGRISDPDRADDVVSEVLLRVHQNLDTIRDPQRVTAWVFQIARNAIIDEYRYGRRHTTTLDGTLDGNEHALPAVPSAEEWVDDQEEMLRGLALCMRPLLAQLPDKYRRALELSDLQQITQAQAARLEGLSVSGMKSRVQRGRQKLTDLLRRCCALTLDSRGLPLEYVPADNCSC